MLGPNDPCSAFQDLESELNHAKSELKRANALTETQARIIRRLVDENLEESGEPKCT